MIIVDKLREVVESPLFCCNQPKFLNRLKPLKKKVGNKLKLSSLFSILLFLDTLFNLIIAVTSYIVGGLMIINAVFMNLYLIVDIFILTGLITKRKAIKYMFIIRLYLVFTVNLLSYILSFVFEVMQQMNIVTLILCLLENIFFLYLVWSVERRKINIKDI